MLWAQPTTKDYISAENKLQSISMLFIPQVMHVDCVVVCITKSCNPEPCFYDLLSFFCTHSIFSQGSWNSLLVKRRTRDRKVASSNPGRSGPRIFFSRVNFVCWLLFGARSTPLLPQWHAKDPGHFAKSAGDTTHLNTDASLTQRSRSGLTMLLSRYSVGTYQETSSKATRQGTLSHSRLSSMSHCGLILA